MQRQRLALRDLLGPDPTLDRDRLRRKRVGLGDTDQRFGEPHERDRLLATPDVQPHVERLGQQRLQLRDVQHDRLPVGHSWAHAREGYRRPR